MLYLCWDLKNSSQEKASKSKNSEKFDDSLLDEPTPSKSSQPSTSKPDSSLQDMIKAMNSQLASLASQFEEFKRSDKPSASKNSLPLSQEQGMSAPVSQTRTLCLPANDTDLSLFKGMQTLILRS